VWGEGGGHQRGKRHWERLLEGRRRSSWRETHARGTTGEKLTGKPARETKLRLPIKAIAGFLKSYNCENHDDDDFCPQDDDNAKMEEAKTNCFYATLKRMSQFLWRPSHQVTLKRKEVFHLGDPKSPI